MGVAALSLWLLPLAASAQLATTIEDFFEPGTQPETLEDPLFESTFCAGCHGFFDGETAPYDTWAGSMMAQSTRDPVFHAALAIANQDAAEAGEFCLRCHTPTGWIGGRSLPADGSGLDPTQGDFDGVTCHVCHRMVDPDYEAGVNPPIDLSILEALPDPPQSEPHSGQYVLDPQDRRRGPFDLGPDFVWHDWEQSAFHRESLMCANCHDVSNPVLSREADGSYKLNDLDARHPTHRKSEQFPIERTYSEWERSVFGEAEIEMGGRFGGNKTAVSSCQDCHMPDTSGVACAPGLGGVERDDLPQHLFAGVNTWVLEAVRSRFPDDETGLSDDIMVAAQQRLETMVTAAVDLVAFPRRGDLIVRVVNQTGHKLPTGYGEGRRIWINVQFFDGDGQRLDEHGAYAPQSAELTTTDTRVYEVKHGLDDYMSGMTGLPVGESFHFVLNNTTLKDNRIPPRGFTNASFRSAQAEVVGYRYLDEQYWDDVAYPIPTGTVTASVRLFQQTTSKEYIEFLRDENTTNNAGQEAYNLWAQLGRSEPIEMASFAAEAGDPLCPPPIRYGLGKVHSLGSRAEIAWSGEPSVSATDFEIILSGGIPGQAGDLLIGPAPQSRKYSGGTLLLTRPKLFASFVVEPDGTARIPVPLGDRPQLANEEKYFQVRFEDPGAADPYALTAGLHVDICR